MPEEIINMLLNLSAVYFDDIEIFKLIHHSIQNSNSYDEMLLMSYIDKVLSMKDDHLTLECLNLLELAIHSYKVLK